MITNLRARLRERRGSYGSVAQKSGLSLSWVAKFATGVKDDPKLRTVAALDSALNDLERDAA